MKSLTFKTREGCKKLLVLFLILILVSSFFARLVQTDFGNLKVERITIDARGAELDGELYYPVGTTSKDLYPGIVITHGGGCTYMSSRIWAEELARRNFVVLNVSAYGAGTSAQPDYDENDQGIEGLNGDLTPMGLLDAKAFLSSLSFVDSTRIGMAGHSMGSRRTGYAAVMDCGYLSLNDRLINVLYDTFGETFTEDEINEDAFTLAESRLNPDQLEYFNSLAAAETELYNDEIRAICLIGGDGSIITHKQTVTVGGIEVQRNCQVNMGILNGDYDTGYYNYPSRDTSKEAWETDGKDIVLEEWYILNDVTNHSTTAGQLYQTSTASSAALNDALANRATRIIIRNPETHSKNFFSNDTTSDLVKFFEQSLQYNRGDLGSADAAPLDASNMTWGWRAFFNIIAMLSMIFMLAALAGILFRSPSYADAVCEAEDEPAPNKKLVWALGILTVILTAIAIYMTNKKGFFLYNPGKFLPLGRTATMTMYFLVSLTVVSVIMLIVNVLISKKTTGKTGLAELNVLIAPKKILKHIAVALLLLCAAYGSLMVIQYLFDQDYRSWMTVFSAMKVEHWFIALKYLIFAFPMYIIMGMAVNFSHRTDIPEWKDTLISIIVNSAGVWIICLINIFIAKTSYDGTLFSSFICSYQFNVFVPITVYLSRKLYRMTKSIWSGAMLNSCLVVWSMACTLGINDIYHGQSVISNFFNI